jgi:ribosomal protein S18 acetylase RimI-like enzyme
MSGQVRDATPMDAQAIGRVHVETWQSAYAGLVPDSYLAGKDIRRQAARWREAIGRNTGESVLVALDEAGDVVGFGSCGKARHGSDGPAFRGEIYTLYVHPDFQERGHGRALLIALIEELAAKGYTDAGLWMLAGNPTRFFYERMGGQAVAEREERFAGVWLPEVAYAWPDLFSWLAQVKQKQKRED